MTWNSIGIDERANDRRHTFFLPPARAWTADGSIYTPPFDALANHDRAIRVGVWRGLGMPCRDITTCLLAGRPALGAMG